LALLIHCNVAIFKRHGNVIYGVFQGRKLVQKKYFSNHSNT